MIVLLHDQLRAGSCTYTVLTMYMYVGCVVIMLVFSGVEGKGVVWRGRGWCGGEGGGMEGRGWYGGEG